MLILSLVIVSERGSAEAGVSIRAAAFQDEMSTIKEIYTILWVQRIRFEAFKRLKRRARPFPATIFQIFNLPAVSGGSDNMLMLCFCEDAASVEFCIGHRFS